MIHGMNKPLFFTLLTVAAAMFAWQTAKTDVPEGSIKVKVDDRCLIVDVTSEELMKHQYIPQSRMTHFEMHDVSGDPETKFTFGIFNAESIRTEEKKPTDFRSCNLKRIVDNVWRVELTENSNILYCSIMSSRRSRYILNKGTHEQIKLSCHKKNIYCGADIYVSKNDIFLKFHIATLKNPPARWAAIVEKVRRFVRENVTLAESC